MSTQVKRPTRPVKPKAVQDTTTPVADTTPATEAVQAVTAPVVAETANKRQQTSKAIGVSISSARTRRHFDKLNLNSHIDVLINELKDQLSSYKQATTALETGKVVIMVEQETEVDGKKVKQSIEQQRDITAEEKATYQATVDKLAGSVAALEMKAAALSRERTRFSNEASITLSIIGDALIQQLAEFTMNNVLAAKKKIIQVPHLHESGVEKLSLYPLIKSLPSFVATAEKLSKKAQSEASAAALAAALAQAERDFKKKYGVHTPKKKKADVAPVADVAQAAVPVPVASPAEPEAEAELEPAEEDDEADSKTSFKFYVGQVCKEVQKKDPRYKAVRVSTEIRGYLSDLLIEFIQRVAPLVHLTATCMKNKTINDVAVLRTVESLLIDGHAPQETVEFRDEMVPDPAVLKVETTKRDEEKKAGRDYKIELEKVPKVQGLVAARTVSYGSSGYAALASTVAEKLKLYAALSEKDKAVAAGEQ